MRSVFFWRVLTIAIIAVLLVSTISLAAYAYIGKKTYISIAMSDLEPEAEVTLAIHDEYKKGSVTEESFKKLIETQTISSESAILIADATGETVIARNRGIQIDPVEFGAFFTSELQNVLSGNTVKNDNLELSNGESAISVGIPIRAEDGTISGCIFIIKQIHRIESAFQELSNALMVTTLIVLPLILIVAAFGTINISKPIRKMSDVALQMANGNFEIRASEKHTGELGILARSLNTLCINLSNTIFQLQNEKNQLNQILSSFSDGVAALDSIGSLTHYNPALMKMFGTVDVKRPIDLVPDQSVWDTFQEVYDSKQQRTLHYKLPGDRSLWISIVPIMSEDQQLCTGVVGLFKDVTEFERLEQTRRDYVANVSHELRTPLTAVRGLLEPLVDGLIQDEETKNRYYRIMLREVERLSRLITDLLQLSRLQSGTEHMEVMAVNLKELLEDTHQNYQHEADQHKIHLALEVGNIPYAMTDPDRIEQILVILIDNAMHYTPEGGTITISAESVSNDSILVSVTDTGCGIAEEDLPHLFERFYKTDKSRREGGTGLGLSIAKQILDRLNETIYVESKLGEGTSFHFTVKKYVSNAIALGPSSSNERYLNAQKVEKTTFTVDEPEDIQDAPFEVIPKPEKKSIKEKTIGILTGHRKSPNETNVSKGGQG